MSAMAHRAASPAVWLNPVRWYKLGRTVPRSLTVDEGDHIWDLLRLGWALRGANVALTVPISGSTNNASGSVVLWDDNAACRLFAMLARDAPLPEDVVNAQP
jgi:hypothetical protein